MQIDTRPVDDLTVIDMTGRLDTSTSDDAYDELVRIAKSGVSNVVLNLDKMEYINSSGLRVMLMAAKLIRSLNGDMKVCNANGLVKEVLETSGFDNIISIHDQENDAIEAFGAS